MQQYDLLSLRSFIAVVDCGSFNQAADLLHASTAAVSRRISNLESALGVKLLNRTTRSQDLTEAGRQFYEDTLNILQFLEEAEERVRCESQMLKGKLRVAAPLSFGIQQIASILPDFMKLYPDLKVELQLEDRFTDLVSEGIDVAMRIGILQDSSLIPTYISDIERVFIASPEYLKQNGTPTRPQQLKSHDCLHYNLISTREEWNLNKGEHNESITITPRLSTNNGEVLMQAALQGMGISLLPRFLVQSAIDSGQLQVLFDDYTPAPFGLYAVRPSRSYTPARVRVFIDYMKQVNKQGCRK